MTSLPIVWYAIFDKEYEKDRDSVQTDKNYQESESKLMRSSFQPGDEKLFMRNPNLFK